MLMDQNIMIKNSSKLWLTRIPKLENKNLKESLKCFFSGETGQFGNNYFATKNALVYRSLSIVDGYTQDVLCLRLVKHGEIYYLGNSSRLEVTDTNIAFGNRSRNWGQTDVQRCLNSMGVPMLPFQAFHEAGLKMVDTIILDRGLEETVKRVIGQNKKNEPAFGYVHFTGASLFKNGDKTFLFDIDREEIKHNIFNPFIVEIPVKVNTIKDAYNALVPKEVKDALDVGNKVLRQGEHFFIKKCSFSELKPTMELPRWSDDGKLVNVPATLSAQGNRDHVCSLFNRKTGLVSGFVEHQGREHKNLDLTDGWYKPVPNTAVRSFTITGDVD
jgi:hypothetical protein